MSDQNPFIEARADKHSSNAKREDCWFDSTEEDALFDAYVILRDAGYDMADLQPLLKLINRTTIYTSEEAESYYNNIVES